MRVGMRILAGILIILGLISMVAAAIAEFIPPRDAFLASEILGLALAQIGIVLWSTSTVSNEVRDSRDLILRGIKAERPKAGAGSESGD